MLSKEELDKVKPKNLPQIVDKNLQKQLDIPRDNLVINAGSEEPDEPDEGLGKSLYANCVAEHYKGKETDVGIIAPDIGWIEEKTAPSGKNKRPYPLPEKIGVRNYFRRHLEQNYKNNSNQLKKIKKAFKEIPATQAKELWNTSDQDQYRDDLEKECCFYATKPMLNTKYIQKADILFVEENPLQMITEEVYILKNLDSALKKQNLWNNLPDWLQKQIKNTLRPYKQYLNNTFQNQYYDFKTSTSKTAGLHLNPDRSDPLHLPKNQTFNYTLAFLGEKDTTGDITRKIKQELNSKQPDYNRINKLWKLLKSLKSLALYENKDWELLLSHPIQLEGPRGNHPKGNQEFVEGVVYKHYLEILRDIEPDVVINYAQARKESFNQILSQNNYNWFTIQPEKKYKTVCHHIRKSCPKRKVLENRNLRKGFRDKVKSLEKVMAYNLNEDNPKYGTYSEAIPHLEPSQARKKQYLGNFKGKGLDTSLFFQIGTLRPREEQVVNQCWNMFGRVPDAVRDGEIPEEYVEKGRIGTPEKIDEGFPVPPDQDTRSVTQDGYSEDIKPVNLVNKELVDGTMKDVDGRMRKQTIKRKHLVKTGLIKNKEQFAEIREYESFADLWIQQMNKIIEGRDNLPKNLQRLPWLPRKRIQEHDRLYQKSGNLYLKDRTFFEKFTDAFETLGGVKNEAEEIRKHIGISKRSWENKISEIESSIYYEVEREKGKSTIIVDKLKLEKRKKEFQPPQKVSHPCNV